MKSIKLDDDIFIDSTGIVHNKKLLSEILKYKYILATTTISTSDVSKITFDSIISQSGGFTLSNGDIIIPNNISKVRISAGIFADITYSSNDRYFWGKVQKNGTSISGNLTPTNRDTFLSCPIPATMIDVEQNDRISIIVDNTCGGKNRVGRSNTWILVECVEI